jgi:hypothetical protein
MMMTMSTGAERKRRQASEPFGSVIHELLAAELITLDGWFLLLSLYTGSGSPLSCFCSLLISLHTKRGRKNFRPKKLFFSSNDVENSVIHTEREGRGVGSPSKHEARLGSSSALITSGIKSLKMGPGVLAHYSSEHQLNENFPVPSPHSCL